MKERTVAKSPARWTTKLSDYTDGEIRMHGLSLEDIADRLDFGGATYLAFSGEIPTPPRAKMMSVLLTAGMIHGIAPSGAISRLLADCGATVPTAIAGGLLSITEQVGGATDLLGPAFEKIDRQGHDSDSHAAAAARAVIEGFQQNNERVHGLGHALHPGGDPRATFLLRFADQLGVAGFYCAVLKQMAEQVRSQKKRPIPPNVDGATVAILMDMGISWKYGSAIIAISRAVGLAAQSVEQKGDPGDLFVKTGTDYVGVARRSFPNPTSG